MVLVGAALFIFAVERIGLGSVMREAKAMGAGLFVILLLTLIRLFLQTQAWAIALEQDGIRATTSELLFLRLASQGIGYLTVLGPAASEPIKIKLLRRHPGSPTAATLVDTGVYWLSAGLVLIAGSVSAAFVLTRNQTASILFAAIIAAALLLLVKPKEFLNPLSSSMGKRAPRWLTKAAQVERQIRDFARRHPEPIRHMLVLDLACQALLLGEVVAGLYFLHLPLRAGAVLSIEAANRAVRLIGGWMPARIGADESGAAGAFAALGMPAAAGLAFALTRRFRDMLGSLVGLLWLAWRTQSETSIASRAATISTPNLQTAPSLLKGTM